MISKTKKSDTNQFFSGVDDGLIDPVSVVVSDQAPPPSLQSGEKCEYVQMKGDKLEGNCMKGGMSCERKCKYKTEEPVCTQILTVRFLQLYSCVTLFYRTFVKMSQRRFVKQLMRSPAELFRRNSVMIHLTLALRQSETPHINITLC